MSDVISEYQQALMDATVEAALHGHGFIRVTHNNGFEVKAIKIEELEELLKFMKDNKHA